MIPQIVVHVTYCPSSYVFLGSCVQELFDPLQLMYNSLVSTGDESKLHSEHTPLACY